jgi:chemotaxis protein MotB
VTQLSEQQKQEAAHFEALRQRLEQELNESRVEITQMKNRMTVINLTSEVLFNSGSSNIKPGGRKVLDLIATSLNAYPNRAISIEGHTDNVPIGKSLRYVSNWDLSVARALAAVDHLQRHNQVAPERLRVVGHGEFKPVASNDTASGRQLNRRIEIRLLAEPGQ